MPSVKTSKSAKPSSQANLWVVLQPYKLWVAALIGLSLVASALNLLVPKIIATNIDAFANGSFVLNKVWPMFLVITIVILAASYLQSIVQTYVSELVAKDLRQKLISKIARQTYAYVQQATSATLLTNLTADVDAVKMFVSQAIVAIVTSIFVIIGASVLLLSIDWQLALAVLAILPLIGGAFGFVFSKVRTKFLAAQKVLDQLNKVINESIVGSTLVRVLHTQHLEYQKFVSANSDARNIGLQILALFASLIPVVGLLANFATLLILVLGGHYVITEQMTLGDFTAFNSYLIVLIFPIFILGFMSNVIARATASYQRLAEVLFTPDPVESGTLSSTLQGKIEVKNVSLQFGQKQVLKHVSFQVEAGSRLGIIGPTGEGKTQLLYVLAGLTQPNSGSILYDGQPIAKYDQVALHQQIGLVFQDSSMFNLTIRENIAFSTTVSDAELTKAIETADLTAFINKLSRGLDTVISERGTSLSGGQKQRIMLARALALNPKVLLLDDFTSRVDTATEQRIIKNLTKNYPDITLISVSQKIASVKEFDRIVLLMDGEILAQGRHEELLKTTPEYVQIYNSQKSTSHYELLAD